ncbi:NUDIX hydrolase domain-like protein [Rhypophila decipiens]
MATPAPEPGQAPRPGPVPSFSILTISQSLSRFDLPAREFISRLKSQTRPTSSSPVLDGVAVGALVFKAPRSGGDSDRAQPIRVLLIQRAKTDSLPDKWEIPSGVVSNNPGKDATITQAVARELWEETGFMAKRLVRLVVGPDGQEGFVFSNSTDTKVFCRYVFEVEVDDLHELKLNPWEHQDYVWASEEEILNLGVEGDEEGKERLLELTSEHLGDLILEAFRLRKEAVVE